MVTFIRTNMLPNLLKFLFLAYQCKLITPYYFQEVDMMGHGQTQIHTFLLSSKPTKCCKNLD